MGIKSCEHSGEWKPVLIIIYYKSFHCQGQKIHKLYKSFEINIKFLLLPFKVITFQRKSTSNSCMSMTKYATWPNLFGHCLLLVEVISQDWDSVTAPSKTNVLNFYSECCARDHRSVIMPKHILIYSISGKLPEPDFQHIVSVKNLTIMCTLTWSILATKWTCHSIKSQQYLLLEAEIWWLALGAGHTLSSLYFHVTYY